MQIAPEQFVAEGISAEFRDAPLGDARRSARLVGIAERAATSPDQSFPKLMRSDAELEALYRFLGNDSVSFADILAPHFAATAARAFSSGRVRVVHDTTDIVYSGKRSGLGPIVQNTRGLFLHTSLVVSGGEERIPLGVIDALPYVRHPRKDTVESLNQRKLRTRKQPRAQKESSRWGLQAQSCAEQLGNREAVHVMDQEADDYALFAELSSARLRFVIRGTSNRLLQSKGVSVQFELEKQSSTLFRTVPLSERKPHRSMKNRKTHPPREERDAQLSVRWAKINLVKPQHAQSDVDALPLFVVQVYEPNPPDGETAISWTLYTNEVVASTADAVRAVDDYRARWRIEEYFRALKQGCAIQERQLESIGAIVNAIAIFVPIAWSLLVLRAIAREQPERSATVFVSADELIVLNALLSAAACKPLPPNPTIRQAMLGIAKLGGHITNNGEPGWRTLSGGYAELRRAHAIWCAAKRQM